MEKFVDYSLQNNLPRSVCTKAFFLSEGKGNSIPFDPTIYKG